MTIKRTLSTRRLTLITFLGLSLVSLVAGGIGAVLLIGAINRSYARLELQNNSEYGRRFAALVEMQLASGKPQLEVLTGVQQTLLSSPGEGSRYLCILSTGGDVLCHPRTSLLGRNAGKMQFLPVESRGPAEPVSFVDWVKRGELEGLMLRDGMPVELIRRIPIMGTDWQVLVHTDLAALQKESTLLAQTILSVMIPTGIFFILLGTMVVRWIGRRHEYEIEEANLLLERRVEERTHQLSEKVAELERAQRALSISEKMALLGQLVAGIAHEINNPLHVITLQAENLKESIQDPDDRRACEAISRNAQRSALLVRNLLSYSRNDPPRRQPLSLHELVETSLALTSGQTQKFRVQVKNDLPAHDIHIHVDRIQIEQVILNLIGNASQALAGLDGDRRIRIAAELANETVQLMVEDNGPGLDPIIREHLFEPFRTTKAEGQGTGLGLSLCKRFVEGHGGEIWYEDVPGGGARFVVRLPSVRQAKEAVLVEG